MKNLPLTLDCVLRRLSKTASGRFPAVGLADQLYAAAAPLLHPRAAYPARLLGTDLAHDHLRGIYRFALRVMTAEGPSVFALLGGVAFDMTPAFGTASAWLNSDDPVAAIRTRGVPATLDLAADYADKAKAALSVFPANDWREALEDLADFAVSRRA